MRGRWSILSTTSARTASAAYRAARTGSSTRVSTRSYKSLGDDYWTPDIIANIWSQAEAGKIPVSGAGYGGTLFRTGLRRMWTDMSEIVRPTRDGIHGREYISTTVDLGRKVTVLTFGCGESSPIPPLVELPMPGDLRSAPLLSPCPSHQGGHPPCGPGHGHACHRQCLRVGQAIRSLPEQHHALSRQGPGDDRASFRHPARGNSRQPGGAYTAGAAQGEESGISSYRFASP